MSPARFLTACLAVLLSQPVLAERADRSQPINLEADTVTYDEASHRSLYQGNVQLSQGSLALRADRLDVRQGDDGLESLSATGHPVAFRQKSDTGEAIEGFADRIDYDSRSGKVEFSGNARLRRGEDELRGASISYNTNTSTYEVHGSDTASGTGTGRVRAIIRPRVRTPSQ